MYPEENITNMVDGFKEAITAIDKNKKVRTNKTRAREIKRFLRERGVILNNDFTWSRT